VLGGIFMMYLPVAQSDHPSIAGLRFVLLGVGAVIVGRDPNGLANKLFGFNAWVMDRLYPMLAERYPGMALRSRGDEPDPVLDVGDAADPAQREVERDVAVAR
jgi:branched-chain amino acid transport system permease protein